MKPVVRVRSDGTGARVVAPSAPRPTAQFMRGEGSPFFFSWRPALRDASQDVQAAWVNAAARAIDAIHNSGWIAGGVEQAIAMTIGSGLQLNAKPDTEILGWTHDAASQWARGVERRWREWASQPVECDLVGRMTMGQMMAAALRSWFATGEIVAQLPSYRRPFATTKTKVLLLPSSRLTQDNEPPFMVQGVRMDWTGFPVAYRFRMNDRAGYERDFNIFARDGVGRPQVVHVFDGMAGQVRGITPLANVLRVVRQFDQLSDATLTAALIQAIFAATVQSEAPTDQVLNALQDDVEQGVGGGSLAGYLAAKSEWYDATKIDLGRAGKIAHLFPGEKLTFHGSEHPNATYDAFARFLLREIARGIGVTFEQLTGDYTGATYSSVRMGTSEVWQIVQYRRKNIGGRFMQPVYEAWLEEEIDAGRVAFPGGLEGFLDVRPAATRAEWRGPAKPQADDLKFAKAAEVLMKVGGMSLEMLCADLGIDWEDLHDQLAREAANRKRLGLPEPQFGAGQAKPDSAGAEAETDGG